MKQTTNIGTEEQLVSLVCEDALSSGRERVIIQTGHFPLLYSPTGAYAAVQEWGGFTPYSAELGAAVGAALRDSDKDVRYLVVADDVNYEQFGDNANFSTGQRRSMRRNFFKNYSRADATLPEEIVSPLRTAGFSESNVLRQDQKKAGRRESLIFSEKIMRLDNDAEQNQCARSYKGLLQDSRYFDSARDYLVSFIPDRCTGNICNRVLEGIEDIAASHVFMQTDSMFLKDAYKDQIWDNWGVLYRHDVPR